MTGPLRSVPYARLRGFTRLFTTYCTGWDLLSAFFGGDWREKESYLTLAGRIQTGASAPLVDALERQNAAWGNPVHEHLDVLRKPRTLAVVTGQQLGLFGGPLYTLYKALTAVKLSERLAEVLERPVVPVFWLEGGDHDLAEVSHLSVPGATQVEAITYRSPTASGNSGSVGQLVLGPDIQRVREDLGHRLPPAEFRRQILDQYYGAYREGVTFTDAFACTTARLLRKCPLVLINPEDPAVKQLVTPLFEKALCEHAEAYARLEAASEALERDYHVQVQPRATHLFYQDTFGRNAIRPHGAGFTIQGSGQQLTATEVISRIHAHPHRFSPNVALRPLVQDTLLPTIAYVAGPGEVSYFAQFKGLYEWAGIPMPMIYPRASITLVEPREQRILRKHDLDMEDLLQDVETLLDRLVVKGSNVDAAFQRAADALAEVLDKLSPTITAVDVTLGRTAEAARAAWLKELGKLRRRVARAEKSRHEVLRSQLVRSQQALFPEGKLQERVLNAAYYLSKYGPSFLDTLYDSITLRTARHQALLL